MQCLLKEWERERENEVKIIYLLLMGNIVSIVRIMVYFGQEFLMNLKEKKSIKKMYSYIKVWELTDS